MRGRRGTVCLSAPPARGVSSASHGIGASRWSVSVTELGSRADRTSAAAGMFASGPTLKMSAPCPGAEGPLRRSDWFKWTWLSPATFDSLQSFVASRSQCRLSDRDGPPSRHRIVQRDQRSVAARQLHLYIDRKPSNPVGVAVRTNVRLGVALGPAQRPKWAPTVGADIGHSACGCEIG